MERLRNTRAARRRHSTKIINEVDDLLASNEFDLAGLRSILQCLEKSADELAKANEALHAEMTDDEALADMDCARVLGPSCEERWPSTTSHRGASCPNLRAIKVQW
ncbi:hypothetical protein MTO96_042437 [Rhipicephalus appendiculatus]